MNRIKFLAKFLVVLALGYLAVVLVLTTVSVIMIRGAMNSAFMNAETETVSQNGHDFQIYSKASRTQFYTEADAGITLLETVKPFLCVLHVPDFTSLVAGSTGYSFLKPICQNTLMSTFDFAQMREYYRTTGEPAFPFYSYGFAMNIQNWLIDRLLTHGMFYLGLAVLFFVSYKLTRNWIKARKVEQLPLVG
jgi:hypothetical protein